MKPKELERKLKSINQRRHNIIRELDKLDELKEQLIRLNKSPKLRKLAKIEIQQEFNGVLIQ